MPVSQYGSPCSDLDSSTRHELQTSTSVACRRAGGGAWSSRRSRTTCRCGGLVPTDPALDSAWSDASDASIGLSIVYCRCPGLLRHAAERLRCGLSRVQVTKGVVDWRVGMVSLSYEAALGVLRSQKVWWVVSGSMFEDDSLCESINFKATLLFTLSGLLLLGSLASLIVVVDSSDSSHDRHARLVYAVVAAAVAGSTQIISGIAAAAARSGAVAGSLTALNVLGGVVVGLLLGIPGHSLESCAPTLIAAAALCMVLYAANLVMGFSVSVSSSDRLFA